MAAEDLPLAGRVVGVTAHRRSEDQIAALERRGARVLHAPLTLGPSAVPSSRIAVHTM